MPRRNGNGNGKRLPLGTLRTQAIRANDAIVKPYYIVDNGYSPYIGSPFGGQNYQFGGSARIVAMGNNQMGEGFFDDIGNFFTKTIPRAATKTWDFVKNNKIISGAAGMLPGPLGTIAGIGARQLGLGRRRRHGGAVRRRRVRRMY